MNRLRLGICEENEKYANKMAAYLLSKREENIETVVFSSPQQALMEKNRVDICLTSYKDADFFEEMGGKAVRLVDQYDMNFTFPQLEKYRSMTSLLSEIRQMINRDLGIARNSKTRVMVVCSPISHELQMLFSMCLCKEWSIKRNVLYVNLRELSGFYQIFDEGTEKDLEDLLIAMQDSKIELNNYVSCLQGVDLLLPPRRPEAFWEMSEKMITEVLSLLMESEYDAIVIDISGYFPGSYSLLSQCDRVIGLAKEGFIHNRIYQEWEEAMSFHLGEQFRDKVMRIDLPLQSGSIKNSEYLLDELYRGNLGEYVRKVAYE